MYTGGATEGLHAQEKVHAGTERRGNPFNPVINSTRNCTFLLVSETFRQSFKSIRGNRIFVVSDKHPFVCFNVHKIPQEECSSSHSLSNGWRY